MQSETLKDGKRTCSARQAAMAVSVLHDVLKRADPTLKGGKTQLSLGENVEGYL